MNEVKHIRTLLESIQLNEYLVRPGDPISEILQLNVFTDMEPGQKLSETDADFANSQEWLAVEAEYAPMAQKIAQKIASINGTLSDIDVETIHSIWYDGSDAYEDVEEAVSFLPDLYNEQIQFAVDLLNHPV